MIGRLAGQFTNSTDWQIALLIITKLSKTENAADFSPQKADQNMKQVGWQES